jgi:hypothetical protein
MEFRHCAIIVSFEVAARIVLAVDAFIVSNGVLGSPSMDWGTSTGAMLRLNISGELLI